MKMPDKPDTRHKHRNIAEPPEHNRKREQRRKPARERMPERKPDRASAVGHRPEPLVAGYSNCSLVQAPGPALRGLVRAPVRAPEQAIALAPPPEL